MTIKQQRVLAIVATDSTYQPAMLDGERVWVGKCIHCNRKLTIADTGTPISRATIEHIWPRTHGGSHELRNIALACSACNRSKSFHDRRHVRDERLAEIVEELRRRRAERWRDPEEVGLGSRIARVLRAPTDDVEDDERET